MRYTQSPEVIPDSWDSLGELVDTRRTNRLVGREEEMRALSELLAPQAYCRILLVHGGPGIGKSALLQAYAYTAERRGHRVMKIDFTGLGDTLSALPGPDSLADVDLLLIDNLAYSGSAEAELREHWLARVPRHVRTVLSGSGSPEATWLNDPGWRSLVQNLRLDALDREAVEQHLGSVVDGGERLDEVMEYTGGHPLLLALTGERLARNESVSLRPDENGEIANALLDRFLVDCGESVHERALHAASVAARVDGDLVAAMLNARDSRAAWEWLSDHPAAVTGPDGLSLPQAIADHLRVGFRGRAPLRHRELVTRAAHHLGDRLTHDLTERGVNEFLYTMRDAPRISELFPTRAHPRYCIDNARSEERPALEQLVSDKWGPEAAEWFRFWWARQPAGLAVMRDAQDQLLGMSFHLDLSSIDRHTVAKDPAMRRFHEHVERMVAPRVDEKAHLCRFLVSPGSDREARIADTHLRCYNIFYAIRTPGVRFTATVCPDDAHTRAVANTTALPPLPESQFLQDGRAFILIGNDWSLQPPGTWVRKTIDRMLGSAALAPLPEPSQGRATTEFTRETIRKALNQIRKGRQPATTPIDNDLTVTAHAVDGSATTTPSRLQDKLFEAVDRLVQDPRTATTGSVLHYTYIEPLGKQRAVAYALELSYGTYRRRLREGLTILAERLNAAAGVDGAEAGRAT